MQKLDNLENEKISSGIAQILKSGKDMDSRQIKALLDYAVSLQQFRGFNLGMISMQDETQSLGNNLSSDMNNLYHAGHGVAYSPEEIVRIQNEYETQRQKLVNEFGSVGTELIDQIMEEVDNNPMEALQKAHDPGIRKAIENYAKAKSLRDGMLSSNSPESPESAMAAEAAEAQVDERVHRDSGEIIEATLKVGDRKVYIIKGDVVMNADGVGVDTRASSDMVRVRDAETGEEFFISPDRIASVSEPVAVSSDAVEMPAEQSMGVADSGVSVENMSEEFRQGYAMGLDTQDMTDEELADSIAEFEGIRDNTEDGLSERGFGILDGLKAERERRAGVATQMQGEEGVLSDEGEIDSETDVEDAENFVTSQYGNRSEQNNDGLAEREDRGRVAGDTAGSVEADRDRSDIRVYEEGLGTSSLTHSEYSERTRRNAESERLVGIARANGQYLDRRDVLSRGEKYPKGTGESEVSIDYDNNRVYKIKNPYAKSPMKGNVQPEDAILEHLVHNKYFPETRYQFEGISEDIGDARIVLSQDYIESVGQPTEEQIEAALAEKGLLPDGKYRYGNDEISVTDVTGDNALLGADGKVYFIDPIIDFKKPVREIIGEPQRDFPAADGNAEPAGSAEISTENEVSDTENASETASTVGNGEESALSRIPVDEVSGEPMFEAVDAETGWLGLLEAAQSDSERAGNIASKQADQARGELEALERKPPVRKNVKLKGSPMAMLKAEEEADRAYEKAVMEHAQKIEDAKSRYAAWREIVKVKTERERIEREERQRQAEAEEEARIMENRERLRREAEEREAAQSALKEQHEQAQRMAIEQLEDEERQRLQEESRAENVEKRLAFNNYEEAMDAERRAIIANHGEGLRSELAGRIQEARGGKAYGQIYGALDGDGVATLEEWVARNLSLGGRRVQWNGHGNLGGQIFGSSEGDKVSERRQYGWMTSDSGESFYEFVHKMWETLMGDESVQFNRADVTDMDVRNMVIDLLRNHPTSRGLFEHAIDLYDSRTMSEGARDALAEMEHYEKEIRDDWYNKNYGLSFDDYEARVENLYEELTRSELSDEDAYEIASMIADEQAAMSNNNITNYETGNDGARQSSSEILHGQQSDWGQRDGTVAAGESASTFGGGNGSGRGLSAEASREGIAGRGLASEEAQQSEQVPGRSRPINSTSGSTSTSKKEPLAKYDRTVPATPAAQRSAISRIIDIAKKVKNRVERAVIGGITPRQAKDFANSGIEVDETWVHSFESSAVAHNQKHHGNDKTEAARGQIAITSDDYTRIPEILETYDKVSKSPNKTKGTENEVIIYEKAFDDGYVYYLEEKRDNRKSLSFQTMYKKKKGTDSSDGFAAKSTAPITPIAPSDNLNSYSDGKGNALSENTQAESHKNVTERSENSSKGQADKSVDDAIDISLTEEDEDGVEYRTPEEGIAYINARAIQPWAERLEALRHKRDDMGLSLSEGERRELRELGSREKAWEERWVEEHGETYVKTGRMSRFDFYENQYGQGGLSAEINRARGEVGSLRDDNGRLISAHARDLARRVLPAIERRREQLLTDRENYSAKGQEAIDSELAELEYMKLYYERMEAGEDVERTMPSRIEHQRMLATGRELASSLGEQIVLHENPSDIEDSDYNRKIRKQRSYGWYDPNDGTIHVNVGLHQSTDEIARTVLHELIGHKSIENIMGKQRFNRMIDEVWKHAGKKVRGKIAEKMGKHNWDFRKATKEYLAELAEDVNNKGFEHLDREQKSFWQRVKAKIQDFLNRILEGLSIPAKIKLTENDLSYMMWKLFKHQQRKTAGKPAEGDIFDRAEEMARREKWNRSGESLSIVARDGGNNMSMADRARAIINQKSIEIESHDYGKTELKEIYSQLRPVYKDGREIVFYNSAFGKNYRPDGNFAKVIPQLSELLEHSQFAYSEPDKLGGTQRIDGTSHRPHPNVKSFDNYVAKAKIGSQEYFVRMTIQNPQGNSASGVHSSMVTNVELYENPAKLNSLPTIHGGAVNYDRITDAKLREFFENAKKNPENLSDYMREPEPSGNGGDMDISYRAKEDMDGNIGLERPTNLPSGVSELRAGGESIVGIEKLSERAQQKLGKYLEKYHSAPMIVLSEEADIEALPYPADVKEQMLNVFRNADNGAAYNHYDKKVCIFADRFENDNHKEYTLNHENIHRAIAPIDEEAVPMLTSIRDRILDSGYNNEQLSTLSVKIAEDYPEEKQPEEFMAYMLPWALRKPERVNQILSLLDDRQREFIQTTILNFLYNGQLVREATLQMAGRVRPLRRGDNVYAVRRETSTMGRVEETQRRGGTGDSSQHSVSGSGRGGGPDRFIDPERQNSIGDRREGNAEVYAATKGLVESAGLPVVEISDAEAQSMFELTNRSESGTTATDNGEAARYSIET